MNEKPIFMSGPMVLALLAGTKTQTRRAVRPSPGRQRKWLSPELLNQAPSVSFGLTSSRGGSRDPGLQLMHPRGGPLGWVRSPYGGPGDRLWVKETHGFSEGPEHERGIVFRASDSSWDEASESLGVRTMLWKPSIFMRRAYSRITLEVTEVRVERLNDISEADAEAEGAGKKIWITSPISAGAMGARGERGTYRDGYKDIWEDINGAGSWALNPWVWVIKFRVVQPSTEIK